MTDTILLKAGMQTLIDRFGVVDAERFISLMIREPVDYTEFRRTLYDDMTLDDVCIEAAQAKKKADRKWNDAPIK